MARSGAVHAKSGYHHGDLSKALLGAVRALIERDGAANFSIAEACKMAGVSSAAPYKHFKDKQDILQRVAAAGFDDMRAEMEAVHSAHDGDQVALIAATGKAYVRFARHNPGVFRLMFGSSPNIKENDMVRETGHECFNTLIQEVARCLGQDPDSEEALKTSVVLWTFVHGIASLTIDEDYDVVRIPIDTDAMIDTATPQLLGLLP